MKRLDLGHACWGRGLETRWADSTVVMEHAAVRDLNMEEGELRSWYRTTDILVLWFCPKAASPAEGLIDCFLFQICPIYPTRLVAP